MYISFDKVFIELFKEIYVFGEFRIVEVDVMKSTLVLPIF